MPRVYEYECPACGTVIEANTHDLQQYCDCDRPAQLMKRKYSLGGIVFKGSGWYHVDKRKTDGGTIGID